MKSHKPSRSPKPRNAGSRPPRAMPELSPLSAGNRATADLFKERIGPPGDALEREADRVADAISRGGMLRPAALSGEPPPGGSVQRKCADCGEKEEEEDTIRRAPKPAKATQPEPEPAPETAVTDATSADAGKSKPAASAGLLVEDEAEPSRMQLRKSEFLAELRTAVCSTVDEAVAGTGRASGGCPWIGHWFDVYAGKSASHLERAIRRYAPESARAATAQDYIDIVTARVRRSVEKWAKTGEISGLPPDMGGGDLLGAFGGMFFKARPGGPRAADPVSVRDRLGEGEPLPGRVRSRMESAFGSGFGGVRIHTGSTGAQVSDELNARAFTVGGHVAFGRGEFRPGTIAGDALIAHELAHVVQQGGASVSRAMGKSPESTGPLEADADRTAAATVYSLWGKAKGSLGRIPTQAGPAIRSGLRLQRCGKSAHEKEVERLGNVQYGFLEEKRKAEEARLKKEVEEDAKKKGLPPPATTPKVDIGDVIDKDVEKHGLKGSPTTAWDTADQPKWKKRAKDAWAAVVASVKGTELEKIADGVTFNFDPKAALEGGFYASQNGHTLTVGMSWVEFAEKDPKNVWENLAHEMAGHFEYGTTYSAEIINSAIDKLPAAEAKKYKDDQKFYEAYKYPETEVYASLWQRRYRVPISGKELPSGGIHPDINIVNKLNVMKDTLHPEVAKAVLKELQRRINANKEILKRDKDFYLVKVKEVFGYDL